MIERAGTRDRWNGERPAVKPPPAPAKIGSFLKEKDFAVTSAWSRGSGAGQLS
jgi:hypothetical protein